MNAKTILGLGFLGGLVWYFTKQAQRLDIGAPSVSKVKIAKNGLQINVKIPVLNRSDFSATITGFLGSLVYGQNVLGGITLNGQAVEIPRRAPAEPEFVTVITLGAVGYELYGILEKILKKEPIDPGTIIRPDQFRIRGTLYVSGLSIDINEPIFS